MSGALFLLMAVIFSVAGSAFLWMRHSKPRSVEDGVDSFSKEMQALAPRDIPAIDSRRLRER